MHSVCYLLRSGLVPSCPAVGLASGKATVLNATLESLPEQLREEVNDHVPLAQHYTSVNTTEDHMCFSCPSITSYWCCTPKPCSFIHLNKSSLIARLSPRISAHSSQ